jgi:hypothetical protein
MPYTDRPGMRQRPLGDMPTSLPFPVGEESSITIWAAPGYVLFIEAMWHGDYQQVPVDPDEIDNLIEALGLAREYVIAEKASRAALSRTQAATEGS